MKELWTLFLTFCRIGGLTFGGGYAMLPMLKKEVVEKYHWATEEELLDYYAVGQCTPGVIAVNTATFVGYKQRGILGAAFATVGVVFPSLVIITIIAAFIKNFTHIVQVQQALAGVRVAVCALILQAILGMWKKSVKGVIGVILFAIAFLVTAIFDLSPIIVVIVAAVIGIVLGKVREKK